MLKKHFRVPMPFKWSQNMSECDTESLTIRYFSKKNLLTRPKSAFLEIFGISCVRFHLNSKEFL